MLMRPSVALIGAAALLLAACGGKATDEADAPASGASSDGGATANAGSFRPGLYTVVQTGDVEIEEERCFLAADVAAGRFGTPGSLSDGWIIDTNRMAGGAIKVVASHPTGSRLNIGGTFERESFEVDGLLEIELNGEIHVVRTKQRGTFASSTCPEGMD